MPKPIYSDAFYEKHFVRDAEGKIITLRFDPIYEAAGAPEPNNRYRPPEDQAKLNGPDPRIGLEKEIGDYQALRLIKLVNLNQSPLPITHNNDGDFYRIELGGYDVLEGNKLYVQVLDRLESGRIERNVEIYEGPSRLSFPELSKGQRMLEGRVYKASGIGRILVHK